MTIIEDRPITTPVTAHIQTITPIQAQMWLDTTNHKNRKMRPGRVAALAADLKNGLWRMTPDAIAFDADGILINGQHRLAAIVKSGIAADAIVIHGMPSETFVVTDDGLKRSFADVLSLHNVPQPHLTGTVVGMVYRWEIAGTPDALLPGEGSRKGSKSSLLHRYNQTPEAFHAAVLAGVRISSRIGMPAGWWGAAMYRFTEKDQADAAYFEHAMQTGEDYQGIALGSTNPLRVLRETLLTDATKHRSFYRKNQRSTIAIMTKAWNAYRIGNEISILKYKGGGEKPEAFPEIV